MSTTGETTIYTNTCIILSVLDQEDYILSLQHFHDAGVVLDSELCQFPHLFLLQFANHSLLFVLGRVLQDVFLQMLVLTLLGLHRVLELILY